MSGRPSDVWRPADSHDEAIEIRPMSVADVPSALSLERSVYTTPWRVEHFAQLLDLPAGLGWVATVVPGEVVGYALGWVSAGEAELANIAVVADRRRGGIGARLIAAVMEEARERGAARLYLEVRMTNASAQSFYRGFGFETVGRRKGYYAKPAEDAYVMAVDLSSGQT